MKTQGEWKGKMYERRKEEGMEYVVGKVVIDMVFEGLLEMR